MRALSRTVHHPTNPATCSCSQLGASTAAARGASTDMQSNAGSCVASITNTQASPTACHEAHPSSAAADGSAACPCLALGPRVEVTIQVGVGCQFAPSDQREDLDSVIRLGEHRICLCQRKHLTTQNQVASDMAAILLERHPECRLMPPDVRGPCRCAAVRQDETYVSDDVPALWSGTSCRWSRRVIAPRGLRRVGALVDALHRGPARNAQQARASELLRRCVRDRRSQCFGDRARSAHAS